jgi:hypothetical protein
MQVPSPVCGRPMYVLQTAQHHVPRSTREKQYPVRAQQRAVHLSRLFRKARISQHASLLCIGFEATWVLVQRNKLAVVCVTVSEFSGVSGLPVRKVQDHISKTTSTLPTALPSLG